jgi:hypothetical protein
VATSNAEYFRDQAPALAAVTAERAPYGEAVAALARAIG